MSSAKIELSIFDRRLPFSLSVESCNLHDMKIVRVNLERETSLSKNLPSRCGKTCSACVLRGFSNNHNSAERVRTSKVIYLQPVMERFAYAYNKRISYYGAVIEQMQSIRMLV